MLPLVDLLVIQQGVHQTLVAVRGSPTVMLTPMAKRQMQYCHSVIGVLGIRQGVLEGLLGGCPFAPSI